MCPAAGPFASAIPPAPKAPPPTAVYQPKPAAVASM
jgi:hypothetical protein